MAEEQAAHLTTPTNAATADSPVPVSKPLTATEAQRQGRRAQRKRRYDDVIALHQQGASQVAIAALLGLHRDTIRRSINLTSFPAHRPTRETKQTGSLQSLPDSNGQSEGQVHKLKSLKRQMYGRANFDLLRKRMLHAA